MAYATPEEIGGHELAVADRSLGQTLLVPGYLRRWVLGVTVLAVVSVASVGFATRHSTRSVLFDSAAAKFFVNSLRSYHGVELFLSHFGDPAVFLTITSIACVTLLILRDYRAAFAVVTSVAFARIAVEDVLKPFFDRHLAGVGGGPTFPSGHTTIAFALAGTVILASGRARPLGHLLGVPLRLLFVTTVLAVSSAIGVAMISLHWHYATDVVVGVPLGLAIAGCMGILVDVVCNYVNSRRRVALTAEHSVPSNHDTGAREFVN